MASHDFSSSLSGRVGGSDNGNSVMRGTSKQANLILQRQTGNHVVLMYLFLTQYTSPRSSLVIAFHRLGA